MQLSPKFSGQYIVKHAKNVKVNELGVERIADEVVDRIKSGELSVDNFSQNDFHPKSDNPVAAINWLFLCDTLNFCFWTPDEHTKWTVEGQTGYFALCAAINRAVREGDDITAPSRFAALTAEDLAQIFRSDDGETPMPMLEERLRCLQEVGAVLLTKYDGSFVNVLKKSDRSAKRLLNLIVDEFPSFRDEADFNGVRVSFYKRAQILIGDIWSCFKGEGLGQFDDIDCISMFADYRVPQVLVHFGALEYGRQLKDVLESNILLRYGSQEEVEIRGASIFIVERAREVAAKRLAAKTTTTDSNGPLPTINSILIDHFLWDYRRKHAQELEHIPFHRTMSIYY